MDDSASLALTSAFQEKDMHPDKECMQDEVAKSNTSDIKNSDSDSKELGASEVSQASDDCEPKPSSITHNSFPSAEGSACTPAATDSSNTLPDPPSPDPVQSAAPTLSKRQRKRQARREEYLAQLPERRRAERQRRKEKRAAAFAAGNAPKRPKLCRMADGSGVRVVVDLSFDELMTERDLGKCLKQVQRCYAANRRSALPVQLHLTSMDGESRRLMDANDGWEKWDVHISKEHFLDVLQHEKITYLSSDSDNEITSLEPGRAYVIGGLVDHNHHKGVCLKRAVEAGIAHARLPIDHFVEMKTRKVLTIDHVFAILLHVAGGKSWQAALATVLPARKGAVLREDVEEEDEEGEEEEGEKSAAGESGEGDGKPKVECGLKGGDEEGSAGSKAVESNGQAHEDVRSVLESEGESCRDEAVSVKRKQRCDVEVTPVVSEVDDRKASEANSDKVEQEGEI